VKTIQFPDWVRLMDSESDTPDELPNGWSPGGAAEFVGMTRQGIHYAIRSGALDAIRVPSPGGHGCYWFIPDAALRAFKRSRKAS
jgi:hypothetical protein